MVNRGRANRGSLNALVERMVILWWCVNGIIGGIMTEIWKPVRDSKYFMVSNLGRVKTLEGSWMRSDGKPYHMKEVIRKPAISNCGYEMLYLGCDIRKRCLVHRLVLEAFNPVDHMQDLQVNHIDGNKQNNVLSNLEWATREDNMQHAIKSGLWVPMYARGDDNPNLKIRDEEVKQIRDLLSKRTMTQHEIALKFGVSDTVVSDIKRNKKRFANM